MSLVAGLILTMMAMQFSYADSRLAIVVHKKICRSNHFFDRQVPKVLVLAIACLNLIYIVKIINNKYDYDNKSNAYSFLRDGTGMTGIYSVMCNHCGITIYISA